MCRHLEDLDKSVSSSQMINDGIRKRSIQVQDRWILMKNLEKFIGIVSEPLCN